jgi:predicted lipid-binding transport protein (Tim44 family)
MKALLLTLAVSLGALALAPTDADARRLGGGGMSGMQRSLPARPPAMATPPKATPAATPAAPAAPAAAAAAAPRRSWLGPIAGLAAGLGIAALMSHLGLGAEFGNIIMLVLLGLVAIVAIRFLLRRFGPAANRAPALATPGGSSFSSMPGGWSGATPAPTGSGNIARSALDAPTTSAADLSTSAAGAATAASVASTLPADFDAAAFERIAKMIFIRMQAANDSGDLNDLRAFTTPEMFAAAKLDLQDRGERAQTTDVVRIDAEVLDVQREADRQIVSVRFHGLIREEQDGVAVPFDEVWHLVRPNDGSREWAIAGIQQMAAA